MNHPDHLFQKAYKSFLASDEKKAENILQKIVKRYPGHLDAVYLLGTIYAERNDFAHAKRYLLSALEISPKSPYVMNNLGLVEFKSGNYELAAEYFTGAIQIMPEFVHARINLANVKIRACLPGEAVKLLYEVLQHAPDYHAARVNLGIALIAQGRADDAMSFLNAAFEANPGDLEGGSIRLFSMNYCPGLSVEEHYRAHATWGKSLLTKVPKNINEILGERPPGIGKIRLGYLSADFNTHPVAYFLLPLLEGHDRERFTVSCYSSSHRKDSMTSAIRAACDAWADITGLSDLEAAKIIRGDGIDILIELGGHSRNSRLAVCAYRPAPIQVSYLGYPNTTGLETINFKISDAVTDPPELSDQYHTESMIRLKRCFLCFRPPSDLDQTLESHRKSNESVTFGSFNNLSKVSDSTLAAWSSILKETSNSRLLIKAQALADPFVRQNLTERIASHGIPYQQLDLREPTITYDQHLATISEVDIALDSFPYNGTTTTCETLWAGVPVITFLGDRHASRVSASILHAIGADELVAKDVTGYIDLAITLGADMDRLRLIKSGLRQKLLKSALIDEENMLSNFESCLLDIWNSYLTQLKV